MLHIKPRKVGNVFIKLAFFVSVIFNSKTNKKGNNIVELIPIILGLFFMVTWTFGVMSRREYATTFNTYSVIWWWISFIVIYLSEMSFWHLFWTMPATLLLSSLFAISVRGPIGFLLGGIPTLIIFLVS